MCATFEGSGKKQCVAMGVESPSFLLNSQSPLSSQFAYCDITPLPSFLSPLTCSFLWIGKDGRGKARINTG